MKLIYPLLARLYSMRIFPIKNFTLILRKSQAQTLKQLEDHTEEAIFLTSQRTDKTFRGEINDNEFRIISSAIGTGAFCVMSGHIGRQKGHVKVEIHKAFKVLLSIGFALLISVSSLQFLKHGFDPNLLFLLTVYILFIRFVFIGLSFRFISKAGLRRMRDVLAIKIEEA